MPAIPSSARSIPATANSSASATNNSHERFVELNDVGAGLLQVAQLLVHRLGIGHQQRARIAIVLVLGEPHHGERARHRDLDRPVRDRAQVRDVAHLHRPRAPDLADDARHDLARLVAALDLRGVVDVDAVERGREAVEVALAPDLSVRHDVEAGRLLLAHRLVRRVVLRLLEVRLGHAPDGVEPDARRVPRQHHLPVHQPVRLRQAPDDGRRHQDVHGVLRQGNRAKILSPAYQRRTVHGTRFR